ncbi:MAG: hypothetical protein D3926_03045 [Desulfobacteraceae bacterium]|nr:MAG: hypothetical protein D3926_03045 [Desulfobacteraceae bacterium]
MSPAIQGHGLLFIPTLKPVNIWNFYHLEREKTTEGIWVPAPLERVSPLNMDFRHNLNKEPHHNLIRSNTAAAWLVLIRRKDALRNLFSEIFNKASL